MGIKITIIGLLGSLILRLVRLTLRWEKVGLSGESRWWADGKPGILMFWHGRQLFMPWVFLDHRTGGSKSPRLAALISQHNDGRMIASAMRFLGIDSVEGSSSRGGLRALHLLVQKLHHNNHIAITPDGPKGPAQKLKNGVVFIAQKCDAEIHPAAFAAERYWQFRSWDKMIFPKPFSRVVLIKGPPVRIAKDLNEQQLAEAIANLEATLNSITQQADEYFKEK